MSCTCERGWGTHSDCPVHGRGAPTEERCPSCGALVTEKGCPTHGPLPACLNCDHPAHIGWCHCGCLAAQPPQWRDCHKFKGGYMCHEGICDCRRVAAQPEPEGSIEYPGRTELQLCALMAADYAAGIDEAMGTFIAGSDMRRIAAVLASVAAQPERSEPGLEELRSELLSRVAKEREFYGDSLDVNLLNLLRRAAAALAALGNSDNAKLEQINRMWAEIEQLRQKVEELRKTRDGWVVRCERAEDAERIATERLALSSQLNGRIMQDEACIQVALECAEAEATTWRSHCEAAVTYAETLEFGDSDARQNAIEGYRKAAEALAAHSEEPNGRS